MEIKSLTVLMIDDDPVDIELMRRYLNDIPTWRIRLVSCNSAEEVAMRLDQERVDIVLLDYLLGAKSGLEVFKGAPELTNCCPVIVITGFGNEEVAVRAMQLGAVDYLVKGSLTPSSLERAIRNALEKHELRRQVEQHRQQLEDKVRELEAALEHVKKLQGLLPICMYCKRIRNDQDSWQAIEAYISDHSEALFSHSICQECLEKHYPEQAESLQQ